LCETVPLVNPENAPEVVILIDCSIKARRCNVPEVEAILGKPDHRVIEFTQAQTLFCGTVLISKARRVMYLRLRPSSANLTTR
jgi:hypothetical protein